MTPQCSPAVGISSRRPQVPLPPVDVLVARVLDHEPDAWQQLWLVLEPALDALLRRPRFLGKLAQREEDCRNIVVEIRAARRAGYCRRLRVFAAAPARQPDLPFWAWMTVVAKRLAIDYLR